MWHVIGLPWLELVALGLALAAIGSIGFHTVVTGISPMPSSRRARRAIMDLLPAAAGGPIFELGAGWGGLALELARRYPDSAVLALERSPLPWLVCRLRAWRATNLEVWRVDFHRVPLADAALLVCYLYPGAMARLAPKLAAELRPAALVVSNGFAVPGWRPAAIRPVDDLFGTSVYLYSIPDADIEIVQK